MSGLVDRLDQLAAVASERPWADGVDYGAVVTQGHCVNAPFSADELRAYGGRPIFESAARPDREFIAGLANAWPALRAGLAAAWEYLETLVCDGQVQRADGEWADCGTCESCRARRPVAALFRETP